MYSGMMILAVLGLILTLKIAWKFGRLAYRLVWGYLIPAISKPRLIRYGKWAVVTGCTAGVGRQYAIELARRGLNVVLISRNSDKLFSLSKQIEEKYGVETRSLQVDFSDGKLVYDRIMEKCKSLDIGILVNNVGVSLEYPMATCDVSPETIWRHIAVNMAPVALLSKLMLPDMVAKRRGAIVNIASSSAIGPLPYLSVYSASKKFVEYFSRGLSYEYRRSGVTVQTLMPFYIATAMMSYSDMIGKKSWLVPDATTFVASAICTLGRLDTTTGYWLHELLFFLCNNQSTRVWMEYGEKVQMFIRNRAMIKE